MTEDEPAARPAGHEPDDRALIRALQSGDEEAAVLLYRRYVERLRGLVRVRGSLDLLRHVGEEDILQSVFGSFFRAARLGYYDVPPGGELWHLLALITLNKVRAKGVFYRAARRDITQTVSGDHIDTVGQGDDAPLVLLNLVIDETLEPLAEPLRQVVRLRMDGYEVAEIAARTGRSRRTVERTLQNFRQRLSEVLTAK